MNQREQRLFALEKQLQRDKKWIEILDTIMDFFEDVLAVASGFMIIGIVGGIERGTISEWKLMPCLVLIVIINIAYRLLFGRN